LGLFCHRHLSCLFFHNSKNHSMAIIQVNFWLAGSLEPPVKNWRVLLEQIFTDCSAIATDNHQIGYTEKVLEIIVVLPRPFL